MIVGALDPEAWSGLVFSDRPGRGFALRWAVERDGERADGADLLYLVHDVGPHDPDGGYARVAFDTDLRFGQRNETPIVSRASRRAGLTVEWSRTTTGAIMRATVQYTGVLELRGYFPWEWTGEWKVRSRSRKESTLCVLCGLCGEITWTRPPETVVADDREAIARFGVVPGEVVGICVFTAENAETAEKKPELFALAVELRSAEEAYAVRRLAAEGDWAELPDSITNNLHWMVSLQPETGRRYLPAGRRWIFPRAEGGREHWTIFAWDAFFNALELSVESPDLARETIEAVLGTQYENGCIPNWRGRFFGTRDRSQPPIGAFCVLKLHQRTAHSSLLTTAFPALERWHSWWTADRRGRPRRDGNANGLCEWGSDPDQLRASPAPWENAAPGRQLAAWESGQDDLPNWDEAGWNDQTGTMELDAVDLNSYLALDAECLGLIAAQLGDERKARAYAARAAGLRDAMNALLWDEAKGLYLDRHWDGRRSSHVAASNFLPLLAGVPDTERARRMLDTLLDPARFWGEHVMPTISRDDPGFADQQYWRGTIWPPNNYLVCQGLRRYRFDQAAAELAGRSVALFLESWRTYRLCRENYDSRTGEGGGDRHQSWGPLFALLGLEEFADVTPWDGLRFGSVDTAGTTVLRRLPLAGRRWDVRLGPDGLSIRMDGAHLVTSDAPIVARHVTLEPKALTAEITATRSTALRTTATISVVEPGVTRVTLPLGRP
jgi:neutral trehalase